ncbi:MAG: FAD-binding oxidoreductase [Proteobacteria bacterium]|nr:FAD-binding oxidoreductase [Pseudomonadota bacterium]
MTENRATIYQALADVVGEDFVSDDLAIRHTYSKDASLTSTTRKHAKDSSTVPAFVALPSTTEEVQGVLRICNRHSVPVVTINTGSNMCGVCVPNWADSLVLDLKRLNQILDIDEKNMTAVIQPHVTIARLQAETMKMGLWNGGTPLAPSSVGLISNMMFNGIWQSALAYGPGYRSLANIKVVLPNGDVINTGSKAIPEAGEFGWMGPGPDLKGIFEFTHYGSLGVVTEATVKLHRWAGGEWPEEESYDRPSVPKNHRFFFVEFPDYKTMEAGLYEIAHSGIGTHLNSIPDAFNAFNTQTTQAMAEKTFIDGKWPKNMIYLVMAGISSERQLDYEEKVLRIIVEQTGGKFIEGTLREEMSTWHRDAFRSGTSARMLRYGGYAVGRMTCSQIETYEKIQDAHIDILSKVPHYLLDEETPEVYVYDRGYMTIVETDNYYDQSSPDEISAAKDQTKDAFITHTKKDGLGWFINIEPLTTIFGPDIGPNFHLWLRRVKNIFDPRNIMNPDKLINMGSKE